MDEKKPTPDSYVSGNQIAGALDNSSESLYAKLDQTAKPPYTKIPREVYAQMQEELRTVRQYLEEQYEQRRQEAMNARDVAIKAAQQRAIEQQLQLGRPVVPTPITRDEELDRRRAADITTAASDRWLDSKSERRFEVILVKGGAEVTTLWVSKLGLAQLLLASVPAVFDRIIVNLAPAPETPATTGTRAINFDDNV